MSYPIILSQGWSLVADDIDAEIMRARKKFPKPDHILAALMEEVGELAQALMENERKIKTENDVYNEAVQVAAMAVRLALEGDKCFPYTMPDTPSTSK